MSERPFVPTSLDDWVHVKRKAKELLKAYRLGDLRAAQLVAAHFEGADAATFRLAQAQLVIARAMGVASWSKLKRRAGAAPRHARRPRARPNGMTGTYIHDVDPVDADAAWALFEAARNGEVDRVRALVNSDPNLVHAQYWYTQPIHLAAYGNHPEAVQALFDAGTQPGRTRYAGGWLELARSAESLGFTDVHRVVLEEARRRHGHTPHFQDLRDAIVARDATRVSGLLGTHAGLARAADLEGNNAVHWAVMTRQPEIMVQLVQAGADPNAERGDGQSPGHLLFNGDYEFRVWRELRGIPHADQSDTLAGLLAAGAAFDLSMACAIGDVKRVVELLEADPGSARALDSGRRNPLTYAARGGHGEIVELLLSHGADPSAPEEIAEKGAALWEACSAGRVDLVRLLLDHGADPASAPDSSDSCIGIARARAGAQANAIVALLEEAGASTPIWHRSNDELAAALRDEVEVVSEPWFAEEVLARNDLELARLLLAKDPDAVERLNGGTLRLGSPDVAITESEVLRLLLDQGFDPNRAGWLGQTALHHYAGRGEVANVVLVIERGADVDAIDDKMRGTPLAWAAAKGHEATVRVLLRHGADPGLPSDIVNAQPLQRARAAGHTRVADILEEALGDQSPSPLPPGGE